MAQIAINKVLFYAEFRKIFGPIKSQETVFHLNKLFEAVELDPTWSDDPCTRIAELAATLATVKWETRHTFAPIDETGKGVNHAYGAPVEIARRQFRRFYGRGLVQLTWLANYARASLLCGVDFVGDPEKVKEYPYCYAIMRDGMVNGWFTGVALGQFIRPGAVDYVGARKVINGTDRAEEIAGIARGFENVITSSRVS